jgi:hypothetical protein
VDYYKFYHAFGDNLILGRQIFIKLEHRNTQQIIHDLSVSDYNVGLSWVMCVQEFKIFVFEISFDIHTYYACKQSVNQVDLTLFLFLFFIYLFIYLFLLAI